MLDLNLNICDSVLEMTWEKYMEVSGRSNSSVMNLDSSSTGGEGEGEGEGEGDGDGDGDGDEDSRSGIGLRFDILKSGGGGGVGLVTKELFPMIGGGETQWLDLYGEQRIIAQPLVHQRQQHQVKKSRRGPRSRTSQYRGVTFYRRTGRWESHTAHSIN